MRKERFWGSFWTTQGRSAGSAKDLGEGQQQALQVWSSYVKVPHSDISPNNCHSPFSHCRSLRAPYPICLNCLPPSMKCLDTASILQMQTQWILIRIRKFKLESRPFPSNYTANPGQRLQFRDMVNVKITFFTAFVVHLPCGKYCKGHW